MWVKRHKLNIGLILLVFGIIIGCLVILVKRSTSTQVNATPVPTTTSIPTKEKVIVKRVLDGDTIELIDNRKVRYIGMDAPETVDPNRPVGCFGKEASAKNNELVQGKEVILEKDVSETDKFGRLLRYVYLNDISMVNEILVKEGFAFARSYPPDVKYQEKLRLAESLARDNNRGLWRTCPAKNNQAAPATSSAVVSEQNVVSGQASANEVPLSGCVIKGNISTKGDKIYHLSGCGSYTRTVIDEQKGERFFCTEDEAQKAGWRKAGNC